MSRTEVDVEAGAFVFAVLKDGWQIASENDIPYLLGRWRRLSSFRGDVYATERICLMVRMAHNPD